MDFELITHVTAIDAGTARFIARRLMEVWQYYLPILGVAAEDFDITTTVQPIVLEPDHEDGPLNLILGGAIALSASDTDQPRDERPVGQGVDFDGVLGERYA